MTHQADVHILICAPFDEYDLAAPVLFRRGAQQDNLPGQIVLDQCGAESERDAHAGDRDQVVPAGMADRRQGVHFRVEAQRSSRGGILGGSKRGGGVGKRRAPGCGEVLVVLLDVEAVVLHEPGENIVGMTDLQMVACVSGLGQECKVGGCILFFKRGFRVVYATCEMRDILRGVDRQLYHGYPGLSRIALRSTRRVPCRWFRRRPFARRTCHRQEYSGHSYRGHVYVEEGDCRLYCFLGRSRCCLRLPDRDVDKECRMKRHISVIYQVYEKG